MRGRIRNDAWRTTSPRPPEQQSGSDNNENCGYEVSGKSAMSMNVYMWGRGEDGQIGLGNERSVQAMLIESLKGVERDQLREWSHGHSDHERDVSSVGDEVMTEDLVTEIRHISTFLDLQLR